MTSSRHPDSLDDFLPPMVDEGYLRSHWPLEYESQMLSSAGPYVESPQQRYTLAYAGARPGTSQEPPPVQTLTQPEQGQTPEQIWHSFTSLYHPQLGSMTSGRSAFHDEALDRYVRRGFQSTSTNPLAGSSSPPLVQDDGFCSSTCTSTIACSHGGEICREPDCTVSECSESCHDCDRDVAPLLDPQEAVKEAANTLANISTEPPSLMVAHMGSNFDHTASPASNFQQLHSPIAEHCTGFYPRGNYISVQHILDAHNPKQPSCSDEPCPINDPNFYGECHGMNLFDGINAEELDLECGLKFSGPDMVQHVFEKHPQLVPPQQVIDISFNTPSDTLFGLSPPPPSSSPAAVAFSSLPLRPVRPPTPASNETHACQWRTFGEAACEEVFKTRLELQQHLEKDHVKLVVSRSDDGTSNYKCDWKGCPYSCKQSSKLARHMKTHSGYKPYICEECGAGLSSLQGFEHHMNIHNGEKPYPCPTCGQPFRHQHQLTCHLRTHTGEKPYACPDCGQRFADSSNLNKHRAAKHTEKGKRRFACQHRGCGNAYPRRDQRDRHMISCKAGKRNAAAAAVASDAVAGIIPLN